MAIEKGVVPGGGEMDNAVLAGCGCVTRLHMQGFCAGGAVEAEDFMFQASFQRGERASIEIVNSP